MIRIRKSTSAGARRFSAVPPMVWSARRFTEAKLKSSENIAPMTAAASMASSSSPLEGEIVVGGLGGLEELRLLHDVYEQHPDEGAEYHNTFEGEVYDTAALGEHAGEGDYHKGNGVDKGLLYQECHLSSPPSSAAASSGSPSSSPSGSSAGSSCGSSTAAAAAGSSAFFAAVRRYTYIYSGQVVSTIVAITTSVMYSLKGVSAVSCVPATTSMDMNKR